jgi:gas vesicle protein
MFLLRLPFLPLKLAFFIGRVLGYNRIAYLTIGVLIGLFFAPTTGAEMREKVRAKLEAGNAAAGTAPSV